LLKPFHESGFLESGFLAFQAFTSADVAFEVEVTPDVFGLPVTALFVPALVDLLDEPLFPAELAIIRCAFPCPVVFFGVDLAAGFDAAGLLSVLSVMGLRLNNLLNNPLLVVPTRARDFAAPPVLNPILLLPLFGSIILFYILLNC
jgi:hypothetical protein